MADRIIDVEFFVALAIEGQGELLADVMRQTLRCSPVLLDFLVGVVLGEIILKGPRQVIVDELRRTFGTDPMVAPVLLDFLVGVLADKIKLKPQRNVKYLAKVERWGRARWVALQVGFEMDNLGKKRDPALRADRTKELCKVYGSDVTDVENFRKGKYKGEPLPKSVRAAEILAAKLRDRRRAGARAAEILESKLR